jgi:hypothetical protein
MIFLNKTNDLACTVFFEQSSKNKSNLEQFLTESYSNPSQRGLVTLATKGETVPNPCGVGSPPPTEGSEEAVGDAYLREWNSVGT